MNETDLTITIISVVLILLILARIAMNLSRIARNLANLNNSLSGNVDVNADTRQMKQQYKMFLRENEGVNDLPHKERYSKFRLWIETQEEVAK